MNKLPFLIFCFLALTASATSVDTYTKNVLLNLHNIERSCLGLGNLTWDATIAAAAQDWAEYLAENDLFKHSGDDGVGENIAEASIRDNMAAFLFSLWADEKEHFSNAKPYPNVSTDGDVVGHYTQIIWGATDSVGCGIANTTSLSYLVCQYKPAGNYKGNYVYTSSDIVTTPNCNPGASQTSTTTNSTTPASSTGSTSSTTSTTSTTSTAPSTSTKTTTTTKVTITTPTHSTTSTNTTVSTTPSESTTSTNTTVSIIPIQPTNTTNTANTTTSTTSTIPPTCTTPIVPTCTTTNSTQPTSPTSPSKPSRPSKSRRGKGKKGKRRVLKVVVDMTKEFGDVEILLRI